MNGQRPGRVSLITLIIITLFVLRQNHAAWADAAPPARPPGSSVGPGEFVTHVQMMSEEVLLEIAGQRVPEDEWGGLAADHMLGHVEAVFVMRNQGETEEAFDVWFPLGTPDGYSNVTTVTGFQAWVDGEPAQVSEALRPGEWESMEPWATWPAAFPPGRDVILRVAYDVLPDGYSPYGTFPYILETGAGWWGPIGEGTITFRLPQEVNKTNAVLHPDAYDAPQTDWFSPNPADYTISGRDVVWHFTDLEPTAEDNVALTVLAPLVWEGIVKARKAAAAQPTSVDVQLQLVRALDGALYYRHGVTPIGDSAEIVDQIQAAYRQVLELVPEDVELYVEYLDWLTMLLEPIVSTLPEDLLPTLERALELAPKDERLLAIQKWVTPLEPALLTPSPTASATAMSTPTTTPAPTETATVTAEPTATATASATPTRRPTASATAIPTATSTPPPSATAAPTQAPESRGGGIWLGAVVIAALVPLGIFLWRNRQKIRAV